MRTRALFLVVIGFGLAACGNSRAEYERAAKTLQPTFDALTTIRAETLLDPKVADGGDIGKTIHDQVDGCVALGDKVAALEADPKAYKEPSLVSMVTSIRRDLDDRAPSETCAAAKTDAGDPIGTLARWKKCVDTCRAWFANMERDVAIFSSNARAAGIESKGMPHDPRFDP